jgi:hypothetical protein
MVHAVADSHCRARRTTDPEGRDRYLPSDGSQVLSAPVDTKCKYGARTPNFWDDGRRESLYSALVSVLVFQLGFLGLLI